MIMGQMMNMMDMAMETYQSSEAKAVPTPTKDDSPLSHEYLKDCVVDYFSATADARALSERCRDYKDGKQWTAEQVAALKSENRLPSSIIASK